MPFRVNAFREGFRNAFGIQNVWSISFRDYPFRGTSPPPPPPPLLRHRPSATTFHQEINKALHPCGHGGTLALKCGETFRAPFGNLSGIRSAKLNISADLDIQVVQAFGQANPLPDLPAPPAQLAQPGHPPDSSAQPVSYLKPRLGHKEAKATTDHSETFQCRH